MATPIKRIEKDFFLKYIYDEQVQVRFSKGKSQFTMVLEKPAKEEMQFWTNRNVYDLKEGQKINIMFDFQGQIISFPVELISCRDRILITKNPEFLYKDLDRSYSRVSAPPDLQVRFTFTNDRYSLSYPKVNEFEPVDEDTIMKSYDPANLNDLVSQMEILIRRFATGYKLIIFRDSKPSSTEERIISETGKCLYIPKSQENLPIEDPYPKKRLITEDMFKSFLETKELYVKNTNDAYNRFLKKKLEKGIRSDLWMPILFQEYVIGYIRVWIDRNGMPPLSFGVLDNMYQFAKILAYSLKINKYFDSGKISNDPFDGRIIDISASGLLFSYPVSSLAANLLPETQLTVELKTPNRTVNNKAKVVRTFKDKVREYFGCTFIDTQPEDLRFLFEYIYGKPFTDKDAAFLFGNV